MVRRMVVADSFVEHLTIDLGHNYWRVARGGGRGGHDLRTFENRGGRPHINFYISVTFSLKRSFFVFSNIFKIKWPKSDEKLNFGGKWVCVPYELSPPPKQNFVATPLRVALLSSSPFVLGTLEANVVPTKLDEKQPSSLSEK